MNPLGIQVTQVLLVHQKPQARTEHDDTTQTLSLSHMAMTYKYSTKKQREQERQETRQVYQSLYYYICPHEERKIYCTKGSGGSMLRPWHEPFSKTLLLHLSEHHDELAYLGGEVVHGGGVSGRS